MLQWRRAQIADTLQTGRATRLFVMNQTDLTVAEGDMNSGFTQSGPSSGLRLEQLLTRYKAWADDLTYEMVAGQSREELLKVRPTTFRTISHTLHHTYIVDDIFRAHIEGVDHGYTTRTADNPPPMQELRESVRTLNRWWIELAADMSQEQLSQPIEFKFLGGEQAVMTGQEMILHVVQHATYHRGYVDDMMYQIPVIPPATDLPVFLRHHRST